MRLRTALGLLLALAFGLAFQGVRPLADPDEGRYAESAREMRETHDFLTPRLAGQPHLTKPPGTYWAAVAGMMIRGVNKAGVRLGLGVFFACWILSAAALGRRLGGDEAAGFWAAVALGTSAGPFVGGSLLTPDSFISALDAAAVAAAAAALEVPQRRRAALRVMWAVLGLAFFFKGPPALLPLAGLAVAWSARAAPERRERPVDGVGLLLFGAIGLSWFLWLGLREPAVLRDLVRRELIVSPFIGGLRRTGPFWMPAAVLLAGSLPWAVALLALRRSRPPTSLARPVVRLLVGWGAAGLLVFTLSRSRMPLYVLPLFTTICVPAGVAASRWARGDKSRRGVVLAVAALSAAGLLAARAGAGRLPSYRQSEQLAAKVRALGAGPGRPVVLLQTTFTPGLAFALDLDLVRAAVDPSEMGSNADLAREQLPEYVGRWEQGVVAVGRPSAFAALPPELVAEDSTADRATGLEAARLRRGP